MKKYLINFFHMEDGVETVEFIGLIVVTAVLVGLAASIAGDVTSTLSSEGMAADETISSSYNAIKGAHKE